MKYNIVSLFSGCGGLDTGFHQAGNFSVMFANDIYEPSVRTFAKNFNLKISNIAKESEGTIFLGDIDRVKFTDFNMKADVVTGGPPCQDFSLLRGTNDRKGITVKRGKLYMHFIRALTIIQPKVFVFENVKGLLSANNGLAFKQIINDFTDLNLRWRDMWENHNESIATARRINHIENYELLFSSIVDFSSLGVPQRRERVIIIGLRKDIAKKLKIQQLKQDINAKLINPKSIFKSYPLTPFETFYGKTLDKLSSEYKKIMSEYAELVYKIKSERSIEYYKKIRGENRFDSWEDYIAKGSLQQTLKYISKE